MNDQTIHPHAASSSLLFLLTWCDHMYTPACSELLNTADEQAVFKAQRLLPSEAVEVCAALHGMGSKIALVGVIPGKPEAMSRLVAGGPLSASISHQVMIFHWFVSVSSFPHGYGRSDTHPA